MPLISVIVTCYNVEEYLDECLKSVVNQTLEDMEIIVVDDGSTDGTRDIIRAYEATDARFRMVFLPENTIGGVGSAANAGLEVATGDFVGFVDGDDFLELTMFEKLCRAAEDGQTDLAMCQYLEFEGNTGKTRKPAENGCWAALGGSTVMQFDTPERVVEILGFIAVPWRKIYSRALLEDNQIRFPVVDYFWEDNPFHWFTVCSARSIAIVPEALCYHRIGRAGQTMNTANQDYVKIFGHHETIREWLRSRDILPQYEVALLSWAFSQFEWVVQRLSPDAGPALYDALVPVVKPVDENTLKRALQGKLRTTGAMMRCVRNEERDEFMQMFRRRFDAESAASREVRARVERSLAMMELAKESVRTYGIRNTVSKILIRFGVPAKVLFSRKNRNKGRALTEEEMLRLLTLLQGDIDRKHTEVMDGLRKLEKEVAELRSKKGQ